MFRGAKNFNHMIFQNVQNCVNTSAMFARAESFNQDLSNWDTRNVEIMSSMFVGAENFNHKIFQNVENVIFMNSMFYNASSFNQDLNKWDTSKVETMYVMFRGAKSFDQNIDSWNVNKVKSMAYMFSGSAFNQNVSSWNVTNVDPANPWIFYLASAFNQTLCGTEWDKWATTYTYAAPVVFIGSLGGEFCAFKLPGPPTLRPTTKPTASPTFENDRTPPPSAAFIGTPKTHNNTSIKHEADKYMNYSGDYISSEYGPIEIWDTSEVTDMRGLFGKSCTGEENYKNVNPDISSWDVSKVEYMQHMFQCQTQFNQNLSNWKVSNLLPQDGTNFMFVNAQSYDQILCSESWISLKLKLSSSTFLLMMFGGTKFYNGENLMDPICSTIP